jgi:DNA polymerase (family 10)
MNLNKVKDACLANGKIREFNAYPERLDLPDLHCRKAKQKSVKLVVSSDARMTEHLGWMTFGVATTRHGWIEAKDVINNPTAFKSLEIPSSLAATRHYQCAVQHARCR